MEEVQLRSDNSEDVLKIKQVQFSSDSNWAHMYTSASTCICTDCYSCVHKHEVSKTDQATNLRSETMQACEYSYISINTLIEQSVNQPYSIPPQTG